MFYFVTRYRYAKIPRYIQSRACRHDVFFTHTGEHHQHAASYVAVAFTTLDLFMSLMSQHRFIYMLMFDALMLLLLPPLSLFSEFFIYAAFFFATLCHAATLLLPLYATPFLRRIRGAAVV